ncbi:MAG: hypothetical protein WBB01_23815 [Phormidesmis sp.]
MIARLAPALPVILFVLAFIGFLFSDTSIDPRDRTVDQHGNETGITRYEQYTKIANFLGEDDIQGLERKVLDRHGVKELPKSTIQFLVKEIVCEQIYINQGKTGEDMLNDMEKSYIYPEQCKQSEYWPHARYPLNT